MQNVATFLNLQFLSHTPFYDIQRTNLMPVIIEAWRTQQQSLFAELRCNGKPLRLCGDGRMDSPGFSAKYCCYTLMDMDTDKVIAFAVVDVSAASGISTNMEVLAFQHCLQELLDNGFTVDVIATDRHVQVRSLLKKKYPTISLMCGMLQNLSVKNVDTDLSQRSWSVCNHLRWSAANCNCDSDMLEETWRCVVHHIVNVHEFEGDVFTKCGHPPLTDDGQSRKKWLTPQSPAHNALKEVVLNKTLLKDIRQLNEFCHTGSLEVYHSLMTKYCPKRQEFDSEQMSARVTLAVLDHNHNTGRQQRLTSEGKPCFKVAYTKTSSKWVAKPVYDPKSYDYVSDMLNAVVVQQETHSLVSVTPSTRHRNIAPVPAPPKDELLARHISRFARN